MESNKLNNQPSQLLSAFSNRTLGKITHNAKDAMKFPYITTWNEIYALERSHLAGQDMRRIPIRQRTLHPSILVYPDTVKNENIKED